ncbi:hypothetical protein SAMN04244560_02904, partial [Thermoanaerobacter thermohydrosulfuricus]
NILTVLRMPLSTFFVQNYIPLFVQKYIDFYMYEEFRRRVKAIYKS